MVTCHALAASANCRPCALNLFLLGKWNPVACSSGRTSQQPLGARLTASSRRRYSGLSVARNGGVPGLKRKNPSCVCYMQLSGCVESHWRTRRAACWHKSSESKNDAIASAQRRRSARRSMPFLPLLSISTMYFLRCEDSGQGCAVGGKAKSWY